MDLRRLFASVRRRGSAKPDESVQNAPAVSVPEELPDETRVRLILADGRSVAVGEDDRVDYLAKNLLRAEERRHD